MSAIVIQFPAVRAANKKPETPVDPFHLPHDKEVAALERALAALRQAMADADLTAVREWRDELAVMELHTDSFDVRGRCQLALKRA